MNDTTVPRRLLVVKMSSMGDVIHTLPAITDLHRQYPDIEVDWVVEEAFQEIPSWHPAVKRVLPIAWRRWRKALWQSTDELRAFHRTLQATEYDWVIDAQGLIKSAAITKMAKGPKYGLDRHSAREGTSAWGLDYPQAVAKGQHAVERVRQLFAQSLDYPMTVSAPDYGLALPSDPPDDADKYLLFLHTTTWANKHWPLTYWRQLAEIAKQQGYQVYLPWGSEREHAQAKSIAQDLSHVTILPKLSLKKLAGWIQHAAGVVAVDSGLAHLSTALNAPLVTVYGPSSIDLTGCYGPRQTALAAQFECAPCLSKECSYRGDKGLERNNSGASIPIWPACFTSLQPQTVWTALSQHMTPSTDAS